MNKPSTPTVVAIALVAVTLAACESPRSDAEREQAAQTRALQNQAQAQVGMPAIKNFQERRLMKQIYELRDQANLITYTYIVDMNGNRRFLTKSIGYGIPYSTQMTAPEKLAGNHSEATALSQPEPNGLYMPESAAATWVIAVKDDGTQVPMYVEPEIIVSPFPLDGGSN